MDSNGHFSEYRGERASPVAKLFFFASACFFVFVLGAALFRGLSFLEFSPALKKAITFSFNFAGFGITSYFVFFAGASRRRRSDRGVTFESLRPREEDIRHHYAPTSTMSRSSVHREAYGSSTIVAPPPSSHAPESNRTFVQPGASGAHLRPQTREESGSSNPKEEDNRTPEQVLSDLVEALHHQKVHALKLVSESKEILEQFGAHIVERVHKNTSTSIDSHLTAKRIIDALESRAEQIDALLLYGADQNPKLLEEFLHSKLRETESGIDNLLDADPLPSLSPSEWEPFLNALILKITRRKSFSRSLKP